MAPDEHAENGQPSGEGTHLNAERRRSLADQVAPHVLDSVTRSIKRQLWLVFAILAVFGATIVAAGRYLLKEAVDTRIEEEAAEFQTKFKKVKDMVNEASVDLGVVKKELQSLENKLAPTDEKAEAASKKANEAEESVTSFEAKLIDLDKRGERLTKEIHELEKIRATLEVEVQAFRKELTALQEESQRLMVARLERNLRLLRSRSAMPHVVKNAVAEMAEDAQTDRLGGRRKEAFALLLEEMRDRLSDTTIRAEAAWALGAFGEQALVPLVATMEDPEELLAVRVAATKALSAVGPAAKGTLLRRLHGWQEPALEEEYRAALAIRAALVVALATIDDDGLLDAVRWALDKKDVEVLWTQIGKPAVPLLVEALRDGPSETREFALEALTRLGEARIDASSAIGTLVTILETDARPRHRVLAATALGEIGMRPGEVVPVLLLQAKGNTNTQVICESIRSLGKFGEAASRAEGYLLAVFQGSMAGSSRPEIAEAAALALGQIAIGSNARVKEALKAVADQEDHPLGPAAKYALANLR